MILIVGVLLGAGAMWFYGTKEGNRTARSTGEQIESGAKSARDAIEEKIRVLDLRPEQIKDDIARGGSNG